MRKPTEFLRAPLFSPTGFVARALLLAIFFGACELAGWREHTTFISGTATTVDTGVNASVTLGLIYMLAWFGFVLGTPILLLASFLLGGFRRVGQRTPPAERRASAAA